MPTSSSVFLLTGGKSIRRALKSLFDVNKGFSLVDAPPLTCPEAIASFLSDFSNDNPAILFELSSDSSSRADLSGIEIARQLRRDFNYQGPLIALGWLSQSEMGQKYSLFKPGVPGSFYLSLPVTGNKLFSALTNASSLTKTDYQEVVLQHCGVKEDARILIHQIAGLFYRLEAALQRIPRQAISESDLLGLKEPIQSLKEQFLKYNLSESAKLTNQILDNLSCVQSAKTIRECLSLLDEIDSGFKNYDEPEEPETNLPSSAPSGFENVLIIDDDGLPLETATFFEKHGYVINILTSTDEAAATLFADPPDVLICDQTLGDDPDAGHKLMNLARTSPTCRLVIALSGSALEPEQVPEADAVCSGPLAKTEVGARRIHQIICRWAMNE